MRSWRGGRRQGPGRKAQFDVVDFGQDAGFVAPAARGAVVGFQLGQSDFIGAGNDFSRPLLVPVGDFGAPGQEAPGMILVFHLAAKAWARFQTWISFLGFGPLKHRTRLQAGSQ